jgi:hypothetical protein
MLHFKLLAATVESILKVALLVVYVISIESFTVVVVSIRLAFTAFFFLLKLSLISVAMVHVLMTAYLHLELTGSLSAVLDLSAFDSCTVLMLLVDSNVLLYACGVSLQVINHVQLFDPLLPVVDHLSTATFFAAWTLFTVEVSFLEVTTCRSRVSFIAHDVFIVEIWVAEITIAVKIAIDVFTSSISVFLVMVLVTFSSFLWLRFNRCNILDDATIFVLHVWSSEDRHIIVFLACLVLHATDFHSLLTGQHPLIKMTWVLDHRTLGVGLGCLLDMLSVAVPTIAEMLVALFRFQVFFLFVEGTDTFRLRIVLFILWVINRVFFDRVAVSTIEAITNSTAMVLKAHLLVSSDSVERSLSGYAATACPVVDNVRLNTTATTWLCLMSDAMSCWLVLLIVALSTCAFILNHLLKVSLTFSAAFLVLSCLDEQAGIRSDRQVAWTRVDWRIVRQVLKAHHHCSLRRSSVLVAESCLR